MQGKIEKIFLVSRIIAWEMAAVNCLYFEGNTCHGQSMRYENVLRLCISVREIFFDAIVFMDINKYGKHDVVQISTVVLPDQHASCQSVLSNRLFLDIYLNTFFSVLNFGNKSAMRFFFFWKMFKI